MGVMTARPAELSWSSLGQSEQRRQLQPGTYRIGRDPSSELPIQAAGVSQQHALLEWVGGHWLLTDLNSTNGLWWRGRRIQQLLLCDGDRIRLAPTGAEGAAELVFHQPAQRPWRLLQRWGSAAAAVLAAYLIGSLSFAVIVSRLMGLNDPRSYGSKNPGATNVLRSGSKKAAILTLLFDALKGWLPVFWVIQYGAPLGVGESTAALAGVAAFMGHLYPVFFKFQGGKGVATSLGVLMGVNPWLGLAIALTWIAVAWFFRYSSLAALLAALLAPVYYTLGGDILWPLQSPLLGLLCLMSILLVWRHRENLNRLLAGTESKLGAKKEAT